TASSRPPPPPPLPRPVPSPGRDPARVRGARGARPPDAPRSDRRRRPARGRGPPPIPAPAPPRREERHRRLLPYGGGGFEAAVECRALDPEGAARRSGSD